MIGYDCVLKKFVKQAAGQIWPTGYSLPTPTLEDSKATELKESKFSCHWKEVSRLTKMNPPLGNCLSEIYYLFSLS